MPRVDGPHGPPTRSRLRSRVVLYSRDEPARVEFESRIGRMADDVEVWAAETDRELLTAIAEGRR